MRHFAIGLVVGIACGFAVAFAFIVPEPASGPVPDPALRSAAGTAVPPHLVPADDRFLGPEGVEAGVRCFLGGDYTDALAEHLARLVVMDGRTVAVLDQRRDAETAGYILGAIAQSIDPEEERHLIAPLAGKLDHYFGHVAFGSESLESLATLATWLDEVRFLRGLLLDARVD